MRKTTALFLSVILICVSLYSYAFAETNKEKDNVIITESHIYGDKSLAENVDIKINMQYRENLLWKMNYSIDDGITKTDFSIHKNRIERDYENNSSFNLYTELHYEDENLADTGINKAYKDIMKNAEPYADVRKTIRLIDYIDYYPITVDCYFPEVISIAAGTALINTAYITDSTENELVTAIGEFFKIPVIKSHEMEIYALVDENRNVIHTGSSSNDGTRELDEFNFSASSVITDKECFIYFSNKTRFGNIADTSEIPGGYGIYRLPYSQDKSTKAIKFSCESLKNVFQLDEKEEIQQLELSADKKSLYMISQNGNNIYLTVIDVESFEEKAKITLSETEGQECGFGYIDEKFIVINHWHENYDERFSLYLPDGKGGFKEEFSTYAYSEDGAYEDTNGNTCYPGASIYMYSNADVKWDGEYLYVTNGSSRFRRPAEYNSFSLAIFNKDGLRFRGQYYTSLSAGFDGYQSSSYYVFLSQHDTIDIVLG